MAKFVEKTEADLAWDRVRREITYRLNLAAANWKFAKLNEIVPRVQEKFEKALNEGRLLEFEQNNDWLKELVKELEAGE